jgi:hypothetical protein
MMKQMMKRIVLAAVLSATGIVQIAAQNIEIKGVVTESVKKDALEFVNVVLQTADSAFVTGAVSGRDGGFTLGRIAAGDYRLVVSSVGYETQYIELEGLKESITLPDILLEEEAVNLNAVTVTGSAVVNKIDRKLIFPTEQQIQASTNGLDLLQKLMLSRIQVNPVTQDVGILGGGEVQLRINGVKVEKNDVIALLPSDIIRVEYHDNPGLRYGNAAAVIDYIVRRHETGGNLGVNLQNSFELKKFGN